MDALTIIGYAMGGLIVLPILLALVAHIPDWRFRRREKQDAYSKLLSIKGKGYAWAIIPKSPHDYDIRNQFHKNNIYVQAKTVNVDCIGHLPNGDFIYRGQDGERFLHYNPNVTSVLIDSAQNVYIPVPSEPELICNRLVISSDDLIIPDNYRILTDQIESKDFLKYYSYLSTYYGNKILNLYHTELQGPKET